jgi:hypothetical protein
MHAYRFRNDLPVAFRRKDTGRAVIWTPTAELPVHLQRKADTLRPNQAEFYRLVLWLLIALSVSTTMGTIVALWMLT